MNRTDRLVAMVMYLQGRRMARAEDMAARFEVSVRTIYRDIAALSESGVPLSGEPGVGYSLLKSYSLPPVMLTAEEASALFVGAEMARQFTDRSMHGPLDTALLKVRAVLPKERQDYMDQLARKTVVVGPSSKSRTPATQRQWLMPLQEAAVRRRVVKLTYRGGERPTETAREVEPLGVVFHGGQWYLVAWCRLRVAMRHFRLDRIQHVDVREEIFQPRPEFSLVQHLGSEACPEQMVAVRIWFSPRALDRVRREGYISILEEKAVDAGTEIVMATYSLNWVAAWILSFGGEGRAVEPEILREQVCEMARLALTRHGEAALTLAQLI